MTKVLTLEESFTDLDDAELWLQGVLIDHAYMEVQEGTCIRYVNHQWQVYVVLED